MAEEFRPSRVILAEIKINNAEVARLNALIRKYTRLKAELSKERESLKELINKLEVIIKETGGTREQVLLLKNYRTREQELPELQKDNEENLSQSQQEYEVAIRLQQSLDKELNETLIFEEQLRLRQTQTLVDISNPINSSNPIPSTIVIPKTSIIEVLSSPSLGGAAVPAPKPGLGDISSVFVKIGKVSLNENITAKNLDYNKIIINDNFHLGVAPSPVIEDPKYLTYTKTSFDFDTTLVITSTFVLVDSELNHSDGSVWGLVSNRFAVNG